MYLRVVRQVAGHGGGQRRDLQAAPSAPAPNQADRAVNHLGANGDDIHRAESSSQRSRDKALFSSSCSTPIS
ncbi:hypothetical protein [Glutamicibacter arilaitensis]|uniref:hypothetical protein n=1 Tax=Glutamicibacter arilaitensis TaxID=256701 RepID=UPI003A920ABB